MSGDRPDVDFAAIRERLMRGTSTLTDTEMLVDYAERLERERDEARATVASLRTVVAQWKQRARLSVANNVGFPTEVGEVLNDCANDVNTALAGAAGGADKGGAK